VDLEATETELPAVAPVAVSELDIGQVLGALERVDDVFQAPVSLFYLQDHSYNEIAEILGVPLGTVKSRLARGLGQLQQLLARDIAAGQTPPDL
jgi:RNA polymerase sigma-70 factor (ECF subfamily)